MYLLFQLNYFFILDTLSTTIGVPVFYNIGLIYSAFLNFFDFCYKC